MFYLAVSGGICLFLPLSRLNPGLGDLSGLHFLTAAKH